MDLRSEIEIIEKYYEQYFSCKSEYMFNYSTDHFFDELESIPFCKEVLDRLVLSHPITGETFSRHEQTEWFVLIEQEGLISQGYEYYIAYCVQYYRYVREKDNPFQRYYEEILWVSSDNVSKSKQLSLFKTDFVRPIVDYIINSYQAESHIVYLINRYCERIERFKIFTGKTDIKEKDLQKDFAKYLFDNGNDFYKEADTCNGQLDFCLPCNEAMLSSWKCGKEQFIIEVKLYNNVRQIQSGMTQLIAYLRQCQSHGCLLIYTDTELEFKNIPQGIQVLTAYIGNQTPSKRGCRTLIDFESCKKNDHAYSS